MGLFDTLGDIVTAPFKAAGSVLGIGGGDNQGGLRSSGQMPTKEIATLNPEAQQLINRKIDRSNQSTQEIADNALKGVQKYNPNSLAPLKKSSSDAFGEAINRSIQKSSDRAFDSEMNKMNRQALLDARKTQFQNTQITNLIAARDNAQYQAYVTAYNNQLSQMDSRNRAISSIIGLGGAGIGLAAGGAKGAAIGSKVGNSVVYKGGNYPELDGGAYT